MKEIQSLSDIFHDSIFRIPDYQRGYAWTIKQCSDLWEDLLNLTENKYHYAGVLSLEPISPNIWKDWKQDKWLIEERNYKPYHVVDGQQRLITIVIMIQAIIEVISEKNSITDNESNLYLGSYTLNQIHEKYISILRPPKNIEQTYLIGYDSIDNPSFQYLRYRIFKERNEGMLVETFYTLNLVNAKTFFKTNLMAAKTNLEQLFRRLAQSLKFNVHEISSSFNVYVAFEVMNNRGKQLSNLELLKNRLIYLTELYLAAEIKDSERNLVRSNINDAWTEVYKQLGRNKLRSLNDDDFLRAHWIMYFSYSRKKGFDYMDFLLDKKFSPKFVLEKIQSDRSNIQESDEIKDTANDEDPDESPDETGDEYKRVPKLSISEINDYVKSLITSAQYWYYSFFPSDNTNISTEEKRWLDKLNRIGVGYFRPMIMALSAKEDISCDERIKLLKAIERFIFVTFKLSRAQSNYRNSAYYGVARDLYYGNCGVDQIIEELEKDMSYTFEDDRFKSSYFRDFISRKFKNGNDGFYGWNGLRYLLYEYELDQAERRGIDKISWENLTKSEKDKISIEHIYPQTPQKDSWKDGYESYSDQELIFIRGSLGNLLPLEMSINSSLQNICFNDKKRVLRDSSGKIIRHGYRNGCHSETIVAEEKQWTPIEIKERGLHLLEFVERRWRIKLKSEEDKLELLHLGFMQNTPQIQG